MIAFDEIVTVNVCLRCGRGFPPWTPLSSSIDTLSVWWAGVEVDADGQAVIRGPVCNGQILAVSRRDQIHRVDAEEFLRGEQWTAEEIAKMDERKEPTCPLKLNRL